MPKKCETPKVLAFNSEQKLFAIFVSAYIASRSLNVRKQFLVKVCEGKQITTNKLYFRYLKDDIEITSDDIGHLKLQEYDKLCNKEVTIYK